MEFNFDTSDFIEIWRKTHIYWLCFLALKSQHLIILTLICIYKASASPVPKWFQVIVQLARTKELYINVQLARTKELYINMSFANRVLNVIRQMPSI